MTKLTYEYTDRQGNVTEVKTMPEVEALISRQGGHYKAIYTPIVKRTASLGFGIKGVTRSDYRPKLA